VTSGPELDRSDAVTETYTHGHHPSVVRSHARRTASNSAAYLTGALRPGIDVLDVGCGPGTITVDFAELVAPGLVLGVDSAGDVVAQARQLGRQRQVPNLRFEVADVYDLGLEEGSFDVVHAHQVLQHLRQPVEALAEMQRVLKPDGVLGVRDADYGAFVWAPDSAEIEAWMGSTTR
jgi:ubiquinone/menaquinone biosynthesis C-methylase UbiE